MRNLDAQRVFLNNFENIINRRVDISEDIQRFQKTLQYARSKVDYAVAEYVYLLPSDIYPIFDNKFCIPLNFEILESSLSLYQYGLGSRLTYELTFADYSDVIKSTDSDATYTISNISLEFETVINASLASQIRTEYMKSSILYDRILRARIIPLNKSDTSFSVDINSPSKSLKGVLLIFTQERSATKFAQDTEEFYNPKITKVEITVEGVPNELYAQNMEYRHQYDEIVKYFAEGRLKEAGAIQKDLQLHNVILYS